MNGYATSLDCPNIEVKIIVPVDALMHQLGDGVMTYLRLNNVEINELILAACELSVMSKEQIPLCNILTTGLHERYINIVEELEYNNMPVDYDTLLERYVEAVYAIYSYSFRYIRCVLMERGVQDLKIPFPNLVSSRIVLDSRGNMEGVLIEMQIQDDGSYSYYPGG